MNNPSFFHRCSFEVWKTTGRLHPHLGRVLQHPLRHQDNFPGAALYSGDSYWCQVACKYILHGTCYLHGGCAACGNDDVCSWKFSRETSRSSSNEPKQTLGSPTPIQKTLRFRWFINVEKVLVWEGKRSERIRARQPTVQAHVPHLQTRNEILFPWGFRDGSAVKSKGCSFRGPCFTSTMHMVDSPQPVWGDLASSGLSGQHTCRQKTDVYLGKKHKHIKENQKSENVIVLTHPDRLTPLDSPSGEKYRTINWPTEPCSLCHVKQETIFSLSPSLSAHIVTARPRPRGEIKSKAFFSDIYMRKFLKIKIILRGPEQGLQNSAESCIYGYLPLSMTTTSALWR